MTLIEQLAEMLSSVPTASVQRNAKEMLVSLALSEGRHQTVRVVTMCGASGQPFVRLQSRARSVEHHSVVRSVLERNAGNAISGLALDKSTQPPMLDVTFGLPATHLYPGEFIDAVFRVANRADAIERQAGGGTDSF